jgi:hypothetical protein
MVGCGSGAISSPIRCTRSPSYSPSANWPQCGSALAVVIAGIVALFVGPSPAWLAAGVGLFVGVVGYAAVTERKRRAASRA